MLRLTLVRHAKAETARHGQKDADRALEPHGELEAHEMGRRLNSQGLAPTCVLSSPAVRALTTATLIGRQLGIAPHVVHRDERLYLAAPGAIMTVIQELGAEATHLMVIGHNPGLSQFANDLSPERSIYDLPTCGVYTVQFEIARWSKLEWLSGVNVQFDYPDRSGDRLG